MSNPTDDPVTIMTSGPAPDALVTEQEYAAREAARTPVTIIDWSTIVKTEPELRAALPKGGLILVAVPGELSLTDPQMVQLSAPNTVLVGLGKHLTSLAIKSPNPNNVSFYITARNVTIGNITLNSNFHTAHCVYSDCLNDPSYLTLDNICIRNCVDGVKYVGLINYPPNYNFTFRNSDIIDHKGYGMFLDVDLANPVIENFYIKGYGKQESFTGIWIGQGLLGGRITNGKIDNSGYNGLEVFYAYCYTTKSQLSRDNPFGPGISISGLEITRIKNIACSLAGTKRSVISNIYICDAGSGMEYIDEINELDGKPMYSDYNAYGVTVSKIKGVGITVHRMKRGRFSNHIITDCGSFGCQMYDGADLINFSDSTFQKCAERMMFSNGATNGTYTGNEFIKLPNDPLNWGFYAFGGSHIFSGNILRGGLKSGANQSIIYTAPGSVANTLQETFVDAHNYRFPA